MPGSSEEPAVVLHGNNRTRGPLPVARNT
jgi:hypothetical protein